MIYVLFYFSTFKTCFRVAIPSVSFVMWSTKNSSDSSGVWSVWSVVKSSNNDSGVQKYDTCQPL